MRILVVDDEPLARARILRLVDTMPDAEVVAEAANGREAIQQVEHYEPDVVLMDIRMPGIDGLEAARHLNSMNKPPAVIFVTAYGDYALEAFDAQAMGYLLKPVQREKLEEALSRARQVTQGQLSAISSETSFGASRTHISTKHRGGMMLIPVREILYFQADQKYVTVKYTDGEVLIEDSLKSLEDEFGESFIRIHRKTLVARRHITGIARGNAGQFHVILKDHPDQPEISRRHVSDVKQAITSI